MPIPRKTAASVLDLASPFTLCRRPHSALRPFVKMFWLSYQPALHAATIAREHVLPTGEMHLVFRLSEAPVRVFRGADDDEGETLGYSLIGGIRAGFYARAVGAGSYTIGAQLRAGAAQALFGVPAHLLTGRHIALDAVWGGSADSIREQLLDLENPQRQLARLEDEFLRRLAGAPTLHPAIAQALRLFRHHSDIGEAVRRSGYSHRHFIDLFTRDVGLTPKRYCRVLRLQSVLRRIGQPRPASLAEAALAAGYSDQPHFNRDFVEFCGLTPDAYRQRVGRFSHHVIVD